MSAPLPESAATAPSVEPRIFVVIPTRDRPALALRAARSALAQRGVAVRVVLVDDGSKTPLSEGLGLDDPRVVIVRQPVSLGVAAARNRGIASSDAPWLAVVVLMDVPRTLQWVVTCATVMMLRQHVSAVISPWVAVSGRAALRRQRRDQGVA